MVEPLRELTTHEASNMSEQVSIDFQHHPRAAARIHR
jgi:hypothetical protein